MSDIVYTLKKKSDTEEYHLFHAKPTIDNKCRPENQSVCKKMDRNESVPSENHITCASESAARMSAAKLGRSVCGSCISSLYKSI